MNVNKVACALLIFISMVYETQAKKCYYCNSANNSACADLHKYKESERELYVPVIECEKKILLPKKVQFFCRKIVQTIYNLPHGKEFRDEERVTRGCGWVQHDKPCYETKSLTHVGRYCKCEKDLCNSADSSAPAAVTLLFLAVAGCLNFYR